MLARIARRGLLLLLGLVVAGLAVEGILQLAARFAAPRRAARGAALAEARIAVFGDSTPFGLGNDLSFPDEIARRTGLPVANRSWPGLNSTQVAQILRQDLTAGSPAVVLVMAGVNDGWNLEEVPAPLLGKAARWYQALPPLRLVRLVAIGIEAGLGRDAYQAAVPTGWSRRDETARLLSTAALRQILATSYRDMRRFTLQTGAQLLFVGYQAEGANHVADLAEAVLRSEHADRFIPIRDLFWRNGARTMIQPDNFHPTDEGQRAIATRVLEDLQRRGWLPAPPEPRTSRRYPL